MQIWNGVGQWSQYLRRSIQNRRRFRADVGGSRTNRRHVALIEATTEIHINRVERGLLVRCCKDHTMLVHNTDLSVRLNKLMQINAGLIG